MKFKLFDRTKDKKVFKIIGVTIVIFASLIIIGNEILSDSYYSDFEPNAEISSEKADCNVVGINLHGNILTYVIIGADGNNTEDYLDAVASEDITYYIRQAENNPNIKGIIMEVDSYGGLPVAGEEVANALKASSKPSVVLIRQAGLSVAYWASTGAEYIFASRNSDVGSIGVTASYLENINKDKKFINLSVGKFKDSGNPDKPITQEEKKLILRDAKIVYDNFIEAVSINRNIPIEKVRKIADGSTFLGLQAKKLGLIDEIGGLYKVQKYLEERIGEKPEICWE